jgi:hypothetical protein
MLNSKEQLSRIEGFLNLKGTTQLSSNEYFEPASEKQQAAWILVCCYIYMIDFNPNIN